MVSRFCSGLAPAYAALLMLVAAHANAEDKKPAPVTFKPGSMDNAGHYRLSTDELALDCKKLSGRMQVRILAVRSYDPNQQSSSLSRSLQSNIAGLTGSSTVAANPDKDNRTDRAMLVAYNSQLAAKGCRPYNLAAELGAQGGSAVPSNTPKPYASPAGAAPH